MICLLQTIATVSYSVKPRFYLVTRGSQSVAGNSDLPSLDQAPLWGIGRTAANEYPDFWGGMIDLDPHGKPDSLAHNILDHVSHSDGEDQVVYRQENRYVPRLHPLGLGECRSFTAQPDGCYLVTGGLGDLGLETAQWIVKHGAKKIILMGRTPLLPRSQWKTIDPSNNVHRQIAAILEMEKDGAEVKTASVDVGDEIQMLAFFSEIRTENWTPVRGVFHTAAQFTQRLLLHHDEESFKSDLHAKIAGAWLLHNLLKDEPLDFFVFYSSMNSFLGLVGLSSYAAANAFLDAIAHYRRALGLCALSVNWGPWSGLGFLRKAVTERAVKGLISYGFEGFSPESALAALGRIMQQQQITQAGVARMDSARSMKTEVPGEGLRVLSELNFLQLSDRSAAKVIEEGGGTRKLRDSFAVLEPGTARSEAMETFLLETVASILRLEQGLIHRDKPMGEFGLDSLMSVELKTRCEKSLGIQLPASVAWNYPTVAALASHLSDLVQISLGEGLEISHFPGETASDHEEFLPDQLILSKAFDVIDQLSEDEAMEKLLRKKANK